MFGYIDKSVVFVTQTFSPKPPSLAVNDTEKITIKTAFVFVEIVSEARKLTPNFSALYRRKTLVKV